MRPIWRIFPKSSMKDCSYDHLFATHSDSPKNLSGYAAQDNRVISPKGRIRLPYSNFVVKEENVVYDPKKVSNI